MFDFRSHFPFFQHQPSTVYLDSAATTQKPQCVIDALTQHYTQGTANVHRASYTLAREITTQFEAARDTVANFLNAKAREEIIWTRGTTEGLNLLAYSLGDAPAVIDWQAGDVIVLSMLEHHANIVPWQQLAKRKGLKLRYIPITEAGTLNLEALPSLLEGPVKLLAISAMSNVLGTVTPLRKIIDAAHAVGAKVVVDAAQAIAHQPLDVQHLDCDFLVFSGHKIYGPNAIGVLFGQQQWLAQMPPWQTGGEMVETVDWFDSEFQSLPWRFEAGTPPVAEAIALAHAIRFLQRWSVDSKATHEQALLRHLEQGLDSISNVTRLSTAPERAAIAAFTVAQRSASEIAAELNQHGIALRAGRLCAMPLIKQLQQTGVIRASLALYSSYEEIDYFISALRKVTQHASQIAVSQNAQATDDASTLIEKMACAKQWEQRYRLLLQLGARLPEMPAADKVDEHRVEGCESAVWLTSCVQDGQLIFYIDSDSRVLRGLAFVLLHLVNNRAPSEILQMALEAEFERLGLSQQLTPSRNNGLYRLIQTIKRVAQNASESSIR